MKNPNNAGSEEGQGMEAEMDHNRAVLCGVYAVQHGPSKHEHCHHAHGKAVWLGLC